MGILEGKRGLIVGIANDRSIASGITESVLAHGGQCLFTHLPGEKMERRIRMSLDELGVKDPWVMPMDAGSDEQMDQVFAKIQSEFGTLDFLVHCIAYAERDWLKVGAFAATPRSVGHFDLESITIGLDLAVIDLPQSARLVHAVTSSGVSNAEPKHHGGVAIATL